MQESGARRTSAAEHPYEAIIALLPVFAVLLAFCAPTDSDYWWHLRTGELIAEHGVPHWDPFAYTTSGHPWLDHEWLAERLMQGLSRLAGYRALALFAGLIQAAQVLLLGHRMRAAAAGQRLRLFLLFFFLVLAAGSWGVRPQIVGPLFCGLFLAILEGYRRDGGRGARLALLPLLMLLWVNLHGSSPLGLALIVTYIAGELIRRKLSCSTSLPLRPLLFALIGCTAAGLANPYGAQLWMLPFLYLGASGTDPQRLVIEWSSPGWSDAASVSWWLSLALLALARPWRHGSGRAAASFEVTPLLLSLGFGLAALRAIYFFPYYAMAILPLVARGLALRWPRLDSVHDQPASIRERRAGRVLRITGPLILTLAMLMLPQAQTGNMPHLAGRLSYPDAAARYLAGLPPSARLYNGFGWGGFLIARLYPRQRVFIDGRIDLYRGAVFEDFLRISELGAGWREILARYGVDTILVRLGEPLDVALSSDGDWRLAYADPLARVYRRAGSDEDRGVAPVGQSTQEFNYDGG